MNEFKFKLGQIVKIKDYGKAYTTYTNWFYEQKLIPNFVERYLYNVNPSELYGKETTFTVVRCGLHNDGQAMLYLITPTYGSNHYFLIEEGGLEKSRSKKVVEDCMVNEIVYTCNSLLEREGCVGDSADYINEVILLAKKLADVICD